MSSLQPSFWCVANIGDANPLIHGGAFVLIDRRGNYCPELWILEPVGEDEYGDPTSWELHTVLMENCATFKDENGKTCISDNLYYPTRSAWFGDAASLASISSFIGARRADDFSFLFMGSLLERAEAWRAVFSYFGPQADARQLDKKQAASLCRRMLRQVKAAESWHDGTGATVNKR